MNGELQYMHPPYDLTHHLRATLTSNCTWESVFRIRITKGWRIKSIFGNYSIKANDLLAVANLHSTHSLCYEFEVDLAYT